MNKEYKIDHVPLTEVQDKLCEILDEFDRICKSHDIKYSIEGGTLLGAVKYNGFVPWDDDIDVIMLRKDYEKFIMACKTDLSDKFFLQTTDTEKEFPLNYAKLRLNDTVYRQLNYTGLFIHHGLFIDIYPLDDVGLFEYKFRLHLLGLLNGGKIKKLGVKKIKCNIIKDAFYSLVSLFPLSVINGLINTIMTRRIKNAKYVYPLFNPSHSITPFEKKSYEEHTSLDFNGRKLMAVQSYEKLLCDSFGDYKNEEPDADTRGPSHAIVQCRINKGKRIGVMTFHEADNYGAVLQAFSLTRAIEKIGKKAGIASVCEIIDYTNEAVYNRYQIRKLSEIAHIKTRIKHLLTVCYKRKNHENFNRFRDVFLNISKKKYNKNNISEANFSYDVIVSGSDQVFNGMLTDNDSNYFLSFAGSDVQKVAYAASIGDESQVADNKELFCHINNFNALSLRENEALKALSDNGYGMHDITIDPSLLLDSDEYTMLLPRTEKKRKKYILVYVIANEKRTFDFAKALAKENNCDVLYINADGLYKPGFKNLRNVSVPEFLSLIKNAECVVTSSFHGVAFSLIFHTPFYYQLSNAEKNFNSRINTLVGALGVSERIVPATDDFLASNINWDAVDEKIKEKRHSAERFLFDNVISFCQNDKGATK